MPNLTYEFSSKSKDAIIDENISIFEKAFKIPSAFLNKMKRLIVDQCKNYFDIWFFHTLYILPHFGGKPNCTTDHWCLHGY